MDTMKNSDEESETFLEMDTENDLSNAAHRSISFFDNPPESPHASWTIPHLDFSLLEDDDEMLTPPPTLADFTIPSSPTFLPLPFLDESVQQRHHHYTPKGSHRSKLLPEPVNSCIQCSLCDSTLHSHQLESNIITSYSFKCSIKASMDKSRDLAFEFDTFERSHDSVQVSQSSSYLPFSVWSYQRLDMDTITENCNCFTFRVGDGFIVHILCLTPIQGMGSLTWINEGKSSHLGIEGGMKYCIQVYSLNPLSSCRIVPINCEKTLSELKRTGLHTQMPALDLTAKEVETNISKKPKTSISNNRNSAADSSLSRLCPVSRSETACSFCSSDCNDLLCSSFYFQSTLPSGPKNLRQKSHYFSVSCQDLSGQIRFKVYADSTIRRGKKSLRNSCFSFPLGPFVVHIKSSSGRKGKNSLKWTVEKKEEFLAFEAELNYTMQLYCPVGTNSSLINSLNVSPCFSSDFRVLCNWSESPPPSIEHPTPFLRKDDEFLQVNKEEVEPGWIMEPKSWKYSSTEILPLCMIISEQGLIPWNPTPILRLSSPLFSSGNVQVEPIQVDSTFGKSLIFSMPKPTSHLSQGTIRVSVISRVSSNTLFETDFSLYQ